MNVMCNSWENKLLLLLIEGQAKNLNSTTHPYDEWTFSPLDFTANWLSHLALAINMLVVNLDALAQASDFRIERRLFVFLCWMHDSTLGSLRNQLTSRLNAQSQTNWAIEDQAKNLNSTACGDEPTGDIYEYIYPYLCIHIYISIT